MTNELIAENFLKCIDWIRENSNKIGNNPLCIGFGDYDYNHPWNDKDFQEKEYSLRINREELPVDIYTYGAYYMQTYGYTKEEIERWEKTYEGTGMNCPCFKHTFEDLDIRAKEHFLKNWKDIKELIMIRIKEFQSLDNFEV